MDFKIAVLGGDGIGPEVTAQGVLVLKALERLYGHRFDLEYGDVGGVSMDNHGTPLSPRYGTWPPPPMPCCSAPWAGPSGTTPLPRSIRKMHCCSYAPTWGVFANIRPVKVYPWLADSSVLKPAVLEGVDLVVVRELTGGLYYAQPKGRSQTLQGTSAVDTMRYSEEEIERVLRVGFEMARSRCGRLASVDKANVLECSRLWRQTAIRLAPEYPEVELEHVLVDSCAMQLIQQPAHFERNRCREYLRRYSDR